MKIRDDLLVKMSLPTTLDKGQGLSTSNQTIISSFYLWYLRIFGLFPSPKTIKNSKNKSCIFQWSFAFSVFMAVGTTGLAVVSFLHERFRLSDRNEQISTMEFFSVVELLNHGNQYFQVCAIFFFMIWKRDKIQALMQNISTVLGEVTSTQQVTSLRTISTLLAFSWIILWLAVSLIGYFARIREDLRSTDKVMVSEAFFVSYSIIEIPKFAKYVILTIGYTLTINTDLAPQIFYLLLVAAIAIGFRRANQTLQGVGISGDFFTENLIEPIQTVATVFEKTIPFLPFQIAQSREQTQSQQVSLLRTNRQFVQKLHGSTQDLNDTLGFLILLNCIRDLTVMVAVVALLLRMDEPLGRTETDLDYARRIHRQALNNRFIYSYTAVSVAAAMLRTIVCLNCHGEGRSFFSIFVTFS
jgi:hypothetical protein